MKGGEERERSDEGRGGGRGGRGMMKGGGRGGE